MKSNLKPEPTALTGVVATEMGTLWWVADSEEELRQWHDKFLYRCIVVECHPNGVGTQITVIFRLPTAQAFEILGYDPDPAEYLIPEDEAES